MRRLKDNTNQDKNVGLFTIELFSGLQFHSIFVVNSDIVHFHLYIQPKIPKQLYKFKGLVDTLLLNYICVCDLM